MSQSKILAIVGPTASGKSDAALRLAREFGAEILSCDSLLVYKGLNIGTAKPTEQELAEIPHHGVDLVEPDQPFTAGDYVRYARPIIDSLIARGKPVLIVGGTGFYLKALLCGVWDAPATHAEIRERLEKEAPEVLWQRLLTADPEYAAKIKEQDVYRVIRALEIIEITKEPVSAMLLKRQLLNPFPHEFKILGIKRAKESLERRIVERTNAMFQNGIINETKALLHRYSSVPRAFECVGYWEVNQFLQEKMTLPESRERMVISTRQLAKKQMTFFKTFPCPIEWYAFPTQESEFYETSHRYLSLSSAR